MCNGKCKRECNNKIRFMTAKEGIELGNLIAEGLRIGINSVDKFNEDKKLNLNLDKLSKEFGVKRMKSDIE